MAGKYGIKNCKEVMELVKVVSLSMIGAIKVDGFQVDDLMSFLKSPEFEAAIGPALEDIKLVPEELKELDFFDGIALARSGYDLASQIIAALKE